MTSHAEWVPRYQRLRAVGRTVANTLVQRVPRDVIDEGGQRLGLLKGDVLVLDTEDEMAVLMDFCLHDVRRQGRTVIERFLAEDPYPADSDEMVFLKALTGAYHSVFVVESVERGVGVEVRDAFRGDNHFVLDLGFSTTASPGAVMATRIIVPEGTFAMTTGAGLPVGRLPAAGREEWLSQMAAARPSGWAAKWSPEEVGKATAEIIRSCLQHGASSHIVYQDAPGVPGSGRALPERPSAGRMSRQGPPRLARPSAGLVGRNDPCPCGSGKKFKKCCGASR